MILFGLFLGFHINNFCKYSYNWGYDAIFHISIIEFIRNHHALPPQEVYGGTNPPLYYIISALILALSSSMKLVQGLSLVCGLLYVWLFFKTLKLVSQNKTINLSLTALFSFLPTTLEFHYMIFNYTLGHLFSLLVIFLVIRSLKREQVSFKDVVFQGLASAVGVLVSLTNFFTLGLIFIPVLSVFRQNSKRAVLLGLVPIIIFLSLVGPYFSYRNNVYQCVFCTKHRTETKVDLTEVYPVKFYYRFNLKALFYPYVPSFLHEGLWPILHTTLYADYFNYLIQPSLNSQIPAEKSKDLVRTGLHYLDKPRIRKFSILSLIGVPITIAFVLGVFGGLSRLFKRSIGRQDFFIDLALLSAVFGCFAQFMMYILRYPDYLNIHAGYLVPAIFCLCLLVSRHFKGKVSLTVLNFLLFSYVSVSFVTFLMI